MLKHLSIIAAIIGSTLSAYFISQNSTDFAFYSIFILVLIIEAMKYLAYPTAIHNILNQDIVKKFTGSLLLVLAMAISTVSAYSQYSRISVDLVHHANISTKELEIITNKIETIEQTVSKQSKEYSQLMSSNQKTKAAAIEVSLHKNTEQLEQLREQKDELEMKTLRQLSSDYTKMVAIVIAISVELFPILLLILGGRRELKKVALVDGGMDLVSNLAGIVEDIPKGKRVFSTDIAKELGVGTGEAIEMMCRCASLKRVGRYFVKC